MPSSQSETPLDGQVRCPAGHLCSGGDNYCRQCGEPLPEVSVDA